jgi:divalent metal cation (Fe/Co/Zn/Cd) transporter
VPALGREQSGVSTDLPQSVAVSANLALRGDRGWLRAAHLARRLAWASLAWMLAEAGIGILAGIQADSLGVAAWAASSLVEALASLIVVWRFSGRRILSETSEKRAQRWVAASFFLVAPYFGVEAIRRLISGEGADVTALSVAITASAVVLMPLLGWAKLRLGRRLSSGATSGEGIQNLMCAGQALAALLAVVGSGAGLSFLDPVAALAISAIALKEGTQGWRGRNSCCAVSTLAPAPTKHEHCGEDCDG